MSNGGESEKCKVLEKIFAGLKKMVYLCSPFASQNAKFFQYGSLNYWLFSERKENVVFICQFPLTRNRSSQDSNNTLIYTMESLILAQDER